MKNLTKKILGRGGHAYGHETAADGPAGVAEVYYRKVPRRGGVYVLSLRRVVFSRTEAGWRSETSEPFSDWASFNLEETARYSAKRHEEIAREIDEHAPFLATMVKVYGGDAKGKVRVHRTGLIFAGLEAVSNAEALNV